MKSKHAAWVVILWSLFLITGCGGGFGGPGAPAGLQANAGRTFIQLTWTASSGAAGYNVYRDGTLIASPTQPTYMDTGLVVGTTHTYGVTAVYRMEESPQSNATATTAPFTKLLGTPADDYGQGIALDASGNIYISGYTAGSLFGTNAGNNDAFIAKYDSSGNRQWGQQFGTTGDDLAMRIAVDSAGNAYVTGYTTGNLGGTNAGNYDIFIAKYDTSGTQQWVKQLGTSGEDYAIGIALDASGNAYITGYTTGNLGGQTNAGGEDIFIAKYDSSGNNQWVKLLGTSANDEAWGIAVDASGNVYITGNTSGNLGGQTNAGGEDAFIAKYDSSGNQLWLKLLGTTATDWANNVCVDVSGNVYITGGTIGNLGGVLAGTTDIFIAKYDASGNNQWVKQLGASGSGENPWDIRADASGNLYVVGTEIGNLGGQTNAGGEDIFIAKFDSSGNNQWVKLLGTSAFDEGAAMAALDALGNVYIAGETQGNLDGQTNAGGWDAFMAKYTPDGNLW